MNKTFFRIIIIISLLLLFSKDIRENFNGMNYIQQHDYLKCCNRYGSCQNNVCQNFLNNNRSPINLIGYLGSSSGKNYNLYSRRNLNSNDDEYFYRVVNSDDDSILKKINKRYLYDDDEIQINNNNYTVKLYDNDNSYFNYPNNRFYIENQYLGNRNLYHNTMYNNPYYFNPYGYNTLRQNPYINNPYGYLNYGYLYDNTNDDYHLLFKLNTGRNRWKYYVKKDDILIPLEEYQNKEIYNNDKVKFPIENKEYTFKEFDS